jgi:hypothetical protein
VKSFLLQPRDAHISAIRLIEPLKCLVIGDDEGYIHVNLLYTKSTIQGSKIEPPR